MWFSTWLQPIVNHPVRLPIFKGLITPQTIEPNRLRHIRHQLRRKGLSADAFYMIQQSRRAGTDKSYNLSMGPVVNLVGQWVNPGHLSEQDIIHYLILLH